MDVCRVKARSHAVNTGSSLAVLRAEIEIMSSAGTIKYSIDSYPYRKDQDKLWRMVSQGACRGYFSGKQQEWLRHDCALILKSSDFAGALTSPGVNYPVQISISTSVENRRVFTAGCTAFMGIHSDAANLEHSQAPVDCCDLIAPKSCVVAIFDRHFLQNLPGSSSLEGQAISQADAAASLQESERAQNMMGV